MRIKILYYEVNLPLHIFSNKLYKETGATRQYQDSNVIWEEEGMKIPFFHKLVAKRSRNVRKVFGALQKVTTSVYLQT